MSATGRKMSFETFLVNQIKYLTDSQDNRMRTFCDNCTWRALPILHVYSYYFGRFSYFKNHINNEFLKEINKVNLPENLNDLENYENWEYARIIKTYNSYLKQNSAGDGLKSAYKVKIKELINTSSKSLNTICKETNLSKGNLSRFINGEYGTLSHNKCKILLSYLTQNC